MTVKPLAPLPMIAILAFGLGLALRQSAQLQGMGDDMVHKEENRQTFVSRSKRRVRRAVVLVAVALGIGVTAFDGRSMPLRCSGGCWCDSGGEEGSAKLWLATKKSLHGLSQLSCCQCLPTTLPTNAR